MKIKIKTFLGYSLSVLSLSLLTISCGEYNKVLTSTDATYKESMANKYYQEGECEKSTPLYKELLSLYKGTSKAERLYFKLASSHFCEGNSLLSAYTFENFERNFTKSEKRTEAYYMIGKCYESLSNPSDLSQEYTIKAVDHFNLFQQKYPDSEYKEEVNTILYDLNNKLIKKNADITLLYLKTEKYKPAIRAINLFLQKYPDSKFVENMKYNLVKAHYELAIRSVEEKKAKRLKNVIIGFQDMKNSFPESSYNAELANLVKKVRVLQEKQ